MTPPDWDDEATPVRPWSTGIQLAELCATEVCAMLNLSTDPLPPGVVSVIAEWSRRAVTRALAPERAEVERLRAELEREREAHERTQREAIRLKSMMRVERS